MKHPYVPLAGGYSIQYELPREKCPQKLKRWVRSEDLHYHLYAFMFNISDTALYLLSLDHSPEHLHISDHLVSDRLTLGDKIGFAGIILGTLCTIVSNQYAYFILNKEYSSGKKLNIDLSGFKKKLLGVIVAASVANKSVATAASFLALLKDYLNWPAYALWTNFGLALSANVLAQSAVQGISGNWHAGFRSPVAKVVSFTLALYYTGSLAALYWNGLDNSSITFGWLSERPAVHSEEGKLKLWIATPFFISTLIRVPVVYYQRMYKRLLSQEKAELSEEQGSTPPSTWQQCNQGLQKMLGWVAGVHRSGSMLLPLAAIFFDLSEQPEVAMTLAIGSVLGSVVGTLKSNLAVLAPRNFFRTPVADNYSPNQYIDVPYEPALV